MKKFLASIIILFIFTSNVLSVQMIPDTQITIKTNNTPLTHTNLHFQLISMMERLKLSLTNELDPIAMNAGFVTASITNGVVFTNDPTYTNAVQLANTAYPSNNPDGFITLDEVPIQAETDPVAMAAGFITLDDLPAETDPVAMNAGFVTASITNGVVFTNNPIYTNTIELANTAYPSNNPDGFITLNDVPDSTISVIGIKESEGVISTNQYNGIKELEFDGGAGFYVDETLPTRAFITLGSHWYTLFLDNGSNYTPSAQQDLQIKMDTNATFAGTFMDTNTTAVKDGETNTIWTLYIPTVAGPAGIQGSVYSTTSITSLAVGSGTKNLTVDIKDGSVDFTAGQPIMLYYKENTWMMGNTISYNKTNGDLSVSIYTNSGAGTYASWVVSLTGTQGRQGNTGAQGIQGFPGYSLGVYSGAWNTNAIYTNNAFFTWNGNVYGSIWTNWSPSTTWPFAATPTNYIAGGQVILLSSSGANGANGLNAVGLTPYGTWNSGTVYTQYALVKQGITSYYNKVSSSINQQPVTNSTVWEPFLIDGRDGVDGADGASGIITSNALWFGQFDSRGTYASNTIVYWAATNYGVYMAIQDCAWYDYNPDDGPPPTGILNTNYFKKLAHFGRDGINGAVGPAGAAGINGTDGTDGADGIGNMWFDEIYDSTKNYENEGIVVIHSNQTYVSKTASRGKIPGTAIGSNAWYLAASKGADGLTGGTYVFMLGWAGTNTYKQGDVVVVSNIFYYCNNTVSGPATYPWGPLGSNYWIRMIDPSFRYYATLPIATYNSTEIYVINQLVRQTNSLGRWNTYICIDGPVSNVNPPDDPTKFAVVASAGQDGLPGATGPAGSNGITTIVYTNWSTNIFHVTTNVLTYYTTNRYTTDIAAVSWTNKSSNNVDFNTNGTLIVTFNTNYSRILGTGATPTNEFNISWDQGTGQLRLKYDTNSPTLSQVSVIVDDKLGIYSNASKYASRVPIEAEIANEMVYIKLSNSYYKVSDENSAITNWVFEYPSTNMGAIWKIDLYHKSGQLFYWLGTGVTNLPTEPNEYSSYIFEVIQGTTNLVAY